MSTEPLHAQTAAAVGWTHMYDRGDGIWMGRGPGQDDYRQIPAFGRTWCDTGGLLTKYKISLTWDHEQWVAQYLTDEGHDQYQGSESPVEAIAKLVVHLHNEGKLK